MGLCKHDDDIRQRLSAYGRQHRALSYGECDDGPRDWTGLGFYKKYVAGLRQGAELGQRCVCSPWDVRQYNSEGVRRSATGWSRMTEMRREMGKMCG